MSAGFIVRGVGRFSGRTLYAEPWGDAGETRRAEDARGPRHQSLGEAVRAAIAMHEDCRDVTILAVAEDGSQTPLASWEEALVESERIRAAIEAKDGALLRMVSPETRAFLDAMKAPDGTDESRLDALKTVLRHYASERGKVALARGAHPPPEPDLEPAVGDEPPA